MHIIQKSKNDGYTGMHISEMIKMVVQEFRYVIAFAVSHKQWVFLEAFCGGLAKPLVVWGFLGGGRTIFCDASQ